MDNQTNRIQVNMVAPQIMDGKPNKQNSVEHGCTTNNGQKKQTNRFQLNMVAPQIMDGKPNKQNSIEHGCTTNTGWTTKQTEFN